MVLLQIATINIKVYNSEDNFSNLYQNPKKMTFKEINLIHLVKFINKTISEFFI